MVSQVLCKSNQAQKINDSGLNKLNPEQLATKKRL